MEIELDDRERKYLIEAIESELKAAQESDDMKKFEYLQRVLRRISE